MAVVPVQSGERLFILDTIRGFALCGILILNIYYFGRPEPANFNLDVYKEWGRPDTYTWYITNFLVEGSFRALFSMLFGAGCILLVGRLEKNEPGLKPADIYFTRLIWLLIFGLINAFVLLWPGDILYSYAVCGLLIFPFRKSSVKLLLFMAVLFIAITVFKRSLREDELVKTRDEGVAALAMEQQHKPLTEDQTEALKKWNERVEHIKVESIHKESEKEIVAMRKSYPDVLMHLLPINKEIESTVFYDNLFYDVMIFIFLGMAFFKMGVLTGESPAWLYVLFVVAGYTLGIGGGIINGNAWRTADFDFYKYYDNNPFPFDVYQLHRILVMLGNLGTIILLWKSGLFKWLLKPFSSVGQMAFTNYLMQSVICTFIFYGYGLGYYGKLQRYELWYVVVSVWIFQLIFSEIWLRYFRFGPLEWVWRSLTYWKRQTFLREL